jgi:branched-chain amino acid transport system permease protein
MKRPLLSFLVLILFGLIFDYSFDAFIQLTLMYILINMLLSMSLNLVNGLTGQFSLGHAGFMAVGAYTSALLSTYIPWPTSGLQFGWHILITLIGGLLAALAGYIVGLPSLRLKGDYLAIVTLGFGEIIRVSLLNSEAVGGARGMYGISGPVGFNFLGFEISKFMVGYVHAIFWVLLCFFLVWRVTRSAYGRVFLSVREDEIAAESMGVNTTQAKVRAFVISSFFAGVAGSLFAHLTNYLNPSTFSFMKSVDAVIMVVLGGMGSISGSILAAVIVTILPEALRPLQNWTGVDLRMVIYSLALILIMILRPKGLFGALEFDKTWAQFKTKYLNKNQSKEKGA